jgi:hypothetical protein
MDNGFDPVWERKKGLGKRVKGPKRSSPSYSSKDAYKEKMGEGVFFNSIERAERLQGRDGEYGI